MPKVSVILTSYNHAKYICESIDSVLNQTFTDFELIILDDASTDNSWWLINQYSDPRIKAFRSKSAGQVTYRLNEAIAEIASGEYIAIHHSDDVWKPEKIEKQVSYLDQHADVGATFSNVLAITERGTVLDDESHFYFDIFDQPNRSRHAWLRYFFNHGNALCHPSVLIRKSCYETCGLYRLGLMQLDDFDMWVRLLMKYDIYVSSDRLINFRVRDGEINVSGSYREARIRNAYEYYKVLSNYREIPSFDEIVAIFPEAKKYYRDAGTDLPFALGLAAHEAADRPFSQLFALDLLFEAVADPARRGALKRNYDFDNARFLAISSRYDIFSGEEILRLGQAVSDRDNKLAETGQSLLERDAQIASLNQVVSERDDEISLFGRNLAERDTLVSDLRQTLSQHNDQIALLHQKATDREGQLVHFGKAISEREGQLISLREMLSDRETHISALGQTVFQCNNQIVELHQTVSEREDQLVRLGRTMSERDTQISELSRTLSQRNDQIAQLHQMASESKVQLAGLDQAVIEGESHIVALNVALSERDAMIVRLNETVSECNSQIASLDREAANLHLELSGREEHVANLEEALSERDEQIRVLVSSRSWRLTKPLRLIGRIARGNSAAVLASLRRKAPASPATTNGAADAAYHSGGQVRGASSEMQSIALHANSPRPVQAATAEVPRNTSTGANVALEQSRSTQATHHNHVATNDHHPATGVHRRQHLRKSIEKVATAKKQRRLDPDFDEAFYLENNPDIRQAGVDPYEHFVQHGRSEGRIGIKPKLVMEVGSMPMDPSRKTVLVVSHEASRTGAPILSLNIGRELQKRFNVVMLVLGDGPMIPAFCEATSLVVGPVPTKGLVAEANRLMAELRGLHVFEFAIVNSIESRIVLQGLARLSIPAISLIHEFAAYTRPRDAFHFAIKWSMDVVFSARITYENAVTEYPELADQSFHILPQGRCTTVPVEIDAETQATEKSRVLRHLRPRGEDDRNTVVVIGAGYVQYRKGVDLFLACAARVISSPGGENCRFVWIGNGYDPAHDMGYSVYLAEQVHRSGLERHFTFMSETAAIEDVYAAADVLMLSSRLDPLPNVAIDAMSHGLPIVCFAKATGIADAIIASGLADECIAPYQDTAAMAGLVLKLAGSKVYRDEVGARLQQTVRDQFDMVRYVARLEELAINAKQRLANEVESAKAILDSELLRQDFFLPATNEYATLGDTIRYGYVRSWATGIGRRKLFPGFHPGIYLENNGDDGAGADPLASYLRAGLPGGPWEFEVISSQEAIIPTPPGARIALHLHVYYPDLLNEIFVRLNVNGVQPDLFVTVPNDRVADNVRKIAGKYAKNIVDIQKVPNTGRDLGPFLTAFGSTFVDRYDIVGHLHTKKSADIADEAMGKVWYQFLMENLLGGKFSMADIILGRMSADPSIGLVFPDDPHIVGWGANRPFAEELGAKLGLRKLPENLVFPVGSMFWARTAAIRPLFDLGLAWHDYPVEPLPYDGSMLHAMERMLPLIAEMQSNRIVLTNVTGVTR